MKRSFGIGIGIEQLKCRLETVPKYRISSTNRSS